MNEENLNEPEPLDGDAGEIIELIDDDGNELKFKILDVIKYKGEKYAFLLAAEPDEEFTENDVVIFRLNEAEETLEPIADDALLDEVFEYYMDEYDDEADDETDEDDTDGGDGEVN